MLGVELETEPAHEIKLRLEEVDMVFLILHERFEQDTQHVVFYCVTMRGGLLVKGASAKFGRQIAVEDLLDSLPNVQRIDHLHVGKTLEKNDPLHDLVGVLHFLDRF